ncbi:MAG: U32 family peptidase [Muribaculaceae bacterium]|nr:U32 family peptidase [Muribaculaceae bacterium]
MNKDNRRAIELLAPARDAEVAIEAVRHGADAVYMGASRFGARAQAGNSFDDIARACDYAHHYDARVYATVNTIVYDHELADVEHLVHGLHSAGVDALIVQDLGLLRLDLPPIALHASTQCDLRTPDKARFLAALGFSQLVMARELTLDEIGSIHQAVDVPLEAFVHGALCVCYSGRCQASQMLMGRSANRGECAQVCRLPFDLEDSIGRKLLTAKHLLSLRDLNLTTHVEQMIAAGVSSLKIEGRLKDVRYVKNVVAHYRRVVDQVIARHHHDLRRASAGMSTPTFEPDVTRSFNRSFTTYFIDGHPLPNGHTMASTITPKSQGEPLGRATQVRGRSLHLDTSKTLVAGDGLGYVGADGTFAGVRVNQVSGPDITLASPAPIPRGAMVYRTHDKAMADALNGPTAERRIQVDASLTTRGNRLTLELRDERGCRATHSIECPPLEAARQPQHERQQAELAKLGDTVYQLRHIDVPGHLFIPASLLSRVRRETVELLDRVHRITRFIPHRRTENREAPCFATHLCPADNVANHLAEQLYRDHGVTSIEQAIEVCPKPGAVVMQTRYCLRRELGACRRDPSAKKLPEHLYLRSGNMRLAVDCDCANCEMRLTIEKPHLIKLGQNSASG